MELFTSLSQFQIAAIILQLAVLPFLIIALRRWWWAKKSVDWPIIGGTVVKGLELKRSKKMEFLYTYKLNGISYKEKKPFFLNSFKNLNVNTVLDLTAKYPEGKKIVVYYNLSNPKISTLEPGRKDGVNSALLLSIFLFSFGVISISYPTLILTMLDYFLKFNFLDLFH